MKDHRFSQQEICCPSLELRFFREDRNFPPFQIPRMELSNNISQQGRKKKKKWWFLPLYDNLLWSTRARKWEFIAYLRIQTSLTITLFDHSGYRKWFCWAEKNAEVMQPGEKTSGGMTVLVITALTCSKKALYNISNPKTSSILLIMSHILHFKVNMLNLQFWEYYIAHLQFLIFQECKAPFQSYCFSGYNLQFYKGWPLFPILILMTLLH